MPLFDLPLDDLRSYRPAVPSPDDFDEFWKATLAAPGPLSPVFTPVDAGLPLVDVFDVTFAGFGGHPIRSWLLLPAGTAEPVPCVVQYLGYGRGRGEPYPWLTWPAAGHATLVMDSRGQGSASAEHAGATPDPHGATHGMLTHGILDPATYYYRRLYTDAVRAVDAARAHPAVDPDRVLVAGVSQGGGVALAVAGLRSDLAGALIDVPFLCHFRRAVELVDTEPYAEITRFCAANRHQVERVFATLSYFDGLAFAARATARALFSVGLMDQVCPPSTVYAAFNAYAGPAEITVHPFNGHEGGAATRLRDQIAWATS
ncbi:acetylxylan esterase [Streptosporangium sp. CA-135522]|uniref:acetylxylan esterase n=1 Tax=Streptosporangium sp. CA-135522 TaxID=3240072 RepID=UPI003D8FE791